MWPAFLYMSKEESIKTVRQLELEAYSLLVSVFRAQGPLTQEKRKILREMSRILNVTIDRHKTEVRRAVNDEKLNTIAYHIHGPGITSEDWCQEGRRVLPMLQRISPQTLHPIITDTFSGGLDIQQNYQEMGKPTFERKKLTGEGHELLFKKSEKMDYSPVFTSDGDPIKDREKDPPSLNTDYPIKHRPLITKSSFYRQSSGSPIRDPKGITKVCSSKKLPNKNQHLMIVSNTQTIPTNSILHKTLSVPMSKVTKLNLDKFKIVSATSLPSSINVSSLTSSGDNAGSSKHKFITSKSGKKVIPLAQLQMLNHKLGSKGIKVLPLNSKLFGKNITVTRITPVPNLNSTASFTLTSTSSKEVMPQECENTIKEIEEFERREASNGKSGDPENLEERLGTFSEIKSEAVDEDFRVKETEGEDSRTKETKTEDLKAEETESEKYIIEEIEDSDFKTETKCSETKETGVYVETEENEEKELKNESDKNLNDTENKDHKAEDDLAALMEIDSSEFIEPELKEPLEVKKERNV